MSVNSENQLKFEIGTTEPLTIMDVGMEELPYGNKFVVHIKPLISGHDHFMPSPGLEKKIKEENVNIGDQITIEKVAKSEQYPYGYFSVSVVDKGKGPQIATDRANKVEKAVQPTTNVETELSPTNKVEIMWKWYQSETQEKGHKPGDEEIPF